MKSLISNSKNNGIELLKIKRTNWHVSSEEMGRFVKDLYGEIDLTLKKAREKNYAGVSNLFSASIKDSEGKVGYSKGFGVLDAQGIKITQICLEQHLDILSREKIYPCNLDFYLLLKGHEAISKNATGLPSPFPN